MLVGDLDTFADRIRPVTGRPLTFTAPDIIRPATPRPLELTPFFRVHDSRYVVYWRAVTPQAYEGVVTQLKAQEQSRLALEGRTLDCVSPGEQQPEVDTTSAPKD